MTSDNINWPIILKWDQGTLLLDGWSLNKPPSAVDPNPWKWDSRVDNWRCDAIYYQQVKQKLSQIPNFCHEVMKPVSVNWPKVDLPKLRSEQTEALYGWMQSGCRSQVIMPTGTGKTVTLQILAEGFSHAGVPVICA